MPRKARKKASAGPIPLILIVIAGLLVFRNSVSIPFIWDDETAIVTNQTIRQLWTLSSISGPLSPPPETPVAGRPIANLSFAVTYALNGPGAAGFHAWNIAFHILCGLLLYAVARRTLLTFKAIQGAASGIGAHWMALAIALLWMLHPLTSEPVDYATQRTESLMGLFLLLTLYCAIRSLTSARSGWWDAAACLCCACGMVSKESMIVAPLVVVLYDRGFQFDSFREAIRRRARLYIGLILTSIILVALVWQASRSTAGFSTGVDSGTYLLNQMRMIALYLRLSVWPHALVLDYGVPATLSLGDVAPQAALVGGLLAATLVALWRWPTVGCLGAIFFLTLAPTSSILPIATEVGAERRMYVPMMALSALAVITGRALLDRIALRASWSPRRTVTVGAAIAVPVLVALGARTISRNREFADPVTLWRTVVDRRPQGRARLGLGMALIAAGNRAEGLSQLQAAAADYSEARSTLGLELFVDGRTDEAIAQLQRYVQDKPLHPSRIPARVVLGEALASAGRLPEAVSEFERVLDQAPRNLEARASLADALFSLKRYKEAVVQYQALGTDIVDPGLELKFGGALDAAGETTEAMGHYQRALQLDPSSAAAHRRLAEAYWRQRALAEATSHAEQAVRLDPRDADTHNMLGAVLASQGRITEAIEQFRAAVSLRPSDSTAQANLQHALSLVREK